MSRDSSNAQLDSSFRRRSADICYSPKGILVVANHQDIEGLGARGSPRELLGLDSSAERVGEAVLRSMHASREGLTKEEAKMESAETLKASGEKSWTTLRSGKDASGRLGAAATLIEEFGRASRWAGISWVTRLTEILGDVVWVGCGVRAHLVARRPLAWRIE